MRPCRITQVFALVVAWGALAAGAGCSLAVDIDTAHLTCGDGRCPAGYACVAQACVRSSGPPPGSCNPTTLVADGFDGDAVDPLWGIVYGGNGASASQVGGALRIELPAGLDDAAYAGYTTDRYYDLTGSSVTVEIATMVDVTSHAQMVLQLYGTAPERADNVGFEQQHGELKLFARTAGTDDTVSIPYDEDAMRFWRLSERAGQLRWETSPDGRAWSLARSVSAPFALDLVRIDLSAGVYRSEVDPGVAEFAAVNGGVPAGARCKVGDLSDDFDDGVPAPVWANRYAEPGCEVDEADGALGASPVDASFGPSYGAYRSAASFDLTGSAVVLEVAQMIDPTPGSPGVAYVKLTASENRHGVEMVEEGGQLKCRTWAAQRYTGVGESAWDADADRFWRLAEADGTVTWSTSPDGRAWTPRCSAPTGSVDVEDVQVEIGAGVTFAAPGVDVGTFAVTRLN